MAVFTICAILVIAAFLSSFLRGVRPEMSLAIGLLAGAGAMLFLITRLSDAIEFVRALLERAGMSGDTALLLLKCLGICLLTQFAADVCKDAGESGLASHAQMIGKVAMLIPALPLFGQILELALAIINGGGAA